MLQTVEALDSERDVLQAELDSKAEQIANLTEELELGHQQADDASRQAHVTSSTSIACIGHRLKPLHNQSPLFAAELLESMHVYTCNSTTCTHCYAAISQGIV